MFRAFTYAKPTAIANVNLETHIEFWDNSGDYANYEDDLSLNASSSSITIGTPAWPPTVGDFYFFAWQQGRATAVVSSFACLSPPQGAAAGPDRRESPLASL